MTTEILLGANTLLFGASLFLGYEWWKDHKAQHRELAESINRLSEVYASKTAVYRAHKRLDELEAVTADMPSAWPGWKRCRKSNGTAPARGRA